VIIFFKRSTDTNFATPVALLDYTRSDDQYTEKEIRKAVDRAGIEILNIPINSAALSVFSLNYAVRYKHSAINLADSLKTSVNVVIQNAPPELVTLINVQQLVGQESVLSLENATKMVVDAQNVFPYGVLFFDIAGPGGTTITLARKFMVYGTSFNFDERRINSKMVIRGASFDSMVMRLKFNLDIDKKSFLVDQLASKLTPAGYQVKASDTGIAHLTPVVARYYPPAPVNKILANVCRDNGVLFDLDEKNKIIKIQGLDSKNPPTLPNPRKFCFRGTPPGEWLISTFAVQDYAGAIFKTEMTGCELFDSVELFDDSRSAGLFATYRAKPAPVLGLQAYQFYVLEYEYLISAWESSLEIKATNNWLISNFRLDTLFENAVYSGANL
jgi:hypothetical protein